MTLVRSLSYAFGLAALLVAAGWVYVAINPGPEGDFFRTWVFFPGSIVELWLSGNVHSGFSGIKGVVVVCLGSAIIWTIPFWLLILLVEIMRRLFRKKKNGAS